MDDALLKDAAVATVNDLLGIEADDEPEVPAQAPSVPEAPAAEAEAQPEAETPDEPSFEFDLSSLNPELPEEFQEPDFEEEAAAEIAARSRDVVDTTGVEEYEDDETRELRKRAIAAEKRAAFLEQQRLKENQAKWRSEAERLAPLAKNFLDDISATSRRGFIREARRIHDRLYPQVAELLATKWSEVTAEAKAEASAAWGKPLAGPGGPPSTAAEAAQQLTAARKSGNLKDIIKARIANGDVNP